MCARARVCVCICCASKRLRILNPIAKLTGRTVPFHTETTIIGLHSRHDMLHTLTHAVLSDAQIVMDVFFSSSFHSNRFGFEMHI